MGRKIFYGIAGALAVFLLFAGWISFQIYKTAQADLAQKADAIVVLGAAEYAGKPSPVFMARLNHAFDLFQKNLAELIITTGGIQEGEKFSEGGVGKKYLENKGIPPDKITADEDSQTTAQNILRTAEIARGKNLKKMIIVSDPFHMYRAKLIAEKAGLEAYTSPTRQSPISKNKWLELRYMARELLLVIKFYAATVTSSF